MIEDAVLWEWASFALRWLHVITAIAWVGSSFYFIALDLSLREANTMPDGVKGEEWQVHGGGFYHIQKYMVAPAHLPENLTWFKWESYATWLSGFALMCVVYYAGADLYLIDQTKAELSTEMAIVISVGSIVIGWLVYDLLCKSPLGKSDTGLMVLLFVLLVALAWGYDQIFTGRAALLHLGAMTATIMSANVFMIIIPNQKIVVDVLKRGETPDAKYGVIAKQRSTHNNYLTLPVIFLMLSNHYPLAFATPYNWLIAACIFLIGVLIRHYFNNLHATGAKPYWTWIASAVLFAVIMWLSTFQHPITDDEDDEEAALEQNHFYASKHFDAVEEIVSIRCSMCHADEPAWEGIARAPKDVKLETAADITKFAREIYMQSGRSHAMPPGNLSGMENEERQIVALWYETAGHEKGAGE